MKILIYILVFLVIGSLIIYFINDKETSAVLWVIVSLLSISLFISLPAEFFLYLFIFSLFLDTFVWEFSNFRIRPSQIMGLLLFFKWLFSIKYKHIIFSNRLFLPLSLFIIISLISTIFNSTNVSRSLQTTLISVVIFCPIFAVMGLLNSREIYERILKYYIWLGIISAIYGVIAYILFIMLNINIGGISTDLGGRIVGMQHEAGDYFGLQMMFFTIIILNHLYIRSTFLSVKKKYLFLLIFIVAMLLSFKRSAFLGIVISLCFSWFILSIQNKTVVFVRRSMGLVIGGFIFVALFNALITKDIDQYSGIKEMLTQRYSKDINFQTETMQARMTTWDYGFRAWREHPLIGSSPSTAEGEFWVTNIFIRSLADIGILGLISIILLLVRIFSLGFRAIRFSGNTALSLNAHVVGMFSAFVVSIFINTVDDQFLVNMFWFHISFIMATFNLAIQNWKITQRTNIVNL